MMRVVQMEPGPTPTLMALAPAEIRSRAPSLFYVSVYENGDGNMEIAQHGERVWNDDYWYYDYLAESDRGLNGFEVNGITTIAPTVSEKWNWSLLVPEPTTATLSLLSLVALAARRRRR